MVRIISFSLVFKLMFLWAISSPGSGVSKEPQLLFSCRSQHSLLDPNYQQGDETYMDVFYVPAHAGLSVWSDPAEGPKVEILSAQEMLRVVPHLSGSTFYAEWGLSATEKPFVSLVYLGGQEKPWGIAFEASPVVSARDPSLLEAGELKLRCDEGAALQELYGDT